jgi:hypothetical protein
MATIPYTAAGAALVYQAASVGGDKFAAASGRLHVRNAGGTACIVTVHSQTLCDQGSTHDKTYTVGAAADRLLGPFDPSRFADTDNFVQLTYDQVASVTVAIIA